MTESQAHVYWSLVDGWPIGNRTTCSYSYFSSFISVYFVWFFFVFIRLRLIHLLIHLKQNYLSKVSKKTTTRLIVQNACFLGWMINCTKDAPKIDTYLLWRMLKNKHAVACCIIVCDIYCYLSGDMDYEHMYVFYHFSRCNFCQI